MVVSCCDSLWQVKSTLPGGSVGLVYERDLLKLNLEGARLNRVFDVESDELYKP